MDSNPNRRHHRRSTRRHLRRTRDDNNNLCQRKIADATNKNLGRRPILSDLGIPYFNPNLYGTPGNLGFIESDENEEVWVFETALDEKVCPFCGPLDGETFLTSDFPDATELDDTTMAANLHENCRCMLILVESYDGEEELF